MKDWIVCLLFLLGFQVFVFGQAVPTHYAGALLYTKDNHSFFANSDRTLCLGTTMNVVGVYDISPTEVIGFDLRTFLTEAAPIVTKPCGNGVKTFSIDIYLKNVLFAKDADGRVVEVSSTNEIKGGEIPFMRLIASLNSKGSDWASSTAWETFYRYPENWVLRQYSYSPVYFAEPYFVLDLDPAVSSNERDKAKASQGNWSLAFARKSVAHAEEESRRTAAATAVQMAEEEKNAKIVANERAERRLAENSTRAAAVLKYYRKDAPPSYDFSGYTSAKFMTDVYTGNFEPYNKGFWSREEWVSDTIRQGFGKADVRDPFGFLLNLISVTADASDVRGVRDSVDAANYAYHSAYENECIGMSDIPWDVSSVFWKLDGKKVENSEHLRLIRTPFLDSYEASYVVVAGPSDPNPTPPAAVENDFRKMMLAEGCHSPALRRFETNLFLMSGWMLPVDKLKLPTPVAGPARIPAPPSTLKKKKVPKPLQKK